MAPGSSHLFDILTGPETLELQVPSMLQEPIGTFLFDGRLERLSRRIFSQSFANYFLPAPTD